MRWRICSKKADRDGGREEMEGKGKEMKTERGRTLFIVQESENS